MFLKAFIPFLLLLLFFLEVLQFLHALDVLLFERLLRFPGVVNVGPVLPFDQVLHLSWLSVVVKVGIGVSICLYGIHCGYGPRCC